MKPTYFTVFLICWTSIVLGQPVEIAYDTVVNAEISEITEVDKYMFTGSVGDEITIRVQTSDIGSKNKRVQILTSSDSVIASKDENYNDMISFIDFVLPYTGSFIITLAPRDGNTTFTYWLSLVCRQQQLSKKIPIAYDTVVNEAIDRIIDMDVFGFDGDSGDIITIRVQTSDIGSKNKRVQILTSSDSVIASKDENYNDMISFIDFVLPYTGSFIITVAPRDGNTTFTYWLSLVCRQQQLFKKITIDCDTVVNDSINRIIDMDVFGFNGDSGNIITIRVQTSDIGSKNKRVQILTSTDSVIASKDENYNDMISFIDFKLPDKDQYVVTVAPRDGNTTFTYWLSLQAISCQHDALVSTIFSPDSIIPPNTAITPTVIIYNNGKNVENTIPVYVRIGTLYYDTTTTKTLQPYEKDTVQFKQWTPPPAGTFTIVCTTALALDSYIKNNSLSKTFIVNNAAPEFTSTPVTTGKEGLVYTYPITTSDADAGASLTIVSSTLPSWLTLTDNGDGTALLTGTPSSANVGANEVVLAVTDGFITTPVNQDFSITVLANAVPAFTSTPITGAKVNKMYTYNIAALDADANASLTVASTSLPSWLTLTDNGNSTAILSGTPDSADVGDHTIILTVTDGIILQPIEHSFTIKVDFETAVAQGDNTNNNKPAAATFNAAPNPVDKNSEIITFSFNGSHINEAQLTVYDAVGNVIYDTEFSLENNGMAQWDLRNRSGNKVANGTYLAMLWLIYEDGTIENLKTSIGVKGY